jgi:hypothetical protein
MSLKSPTPNSISCTRYSGAHDWNKWGEPKSNDRGKVQLRTCKTCGIVDARYVTIIVREDNTE